MVPLGLRLGATSSRGVARLVPACKHGRWVRCRKYHERKGLPYPIDEGLGAFLSPEALKVIAVDYQNGLLERLNDQVRGTVLQDKSVAQTAIEAARDPHKVLEFDYACEALNNSFFLESLKPPTAPEKSNEAAIERKHNGLLSAILNQAGSFEQFKSNFSAAVLGMFSSGWMYCVVDNSGQIGIYPVFGAGTLLIRSGESTVGNDRIVGELIARGRQRSSSPAPAVNAEPSEPSTTSSPVSGMSQPPSSTSPLPPHVRTFSVSAATRSTFSQGPISADNIYNPDSDLVPQTVDVGAESKMQAMKAGEVLNPLFCVSVHEHAWMLGYGVWGKEEYMKRFWTVLDWAEVARRYETFVMGTRRPLDLLDQA
ncbi:manganese and iron superoxide dismutase [Daedalea quercina L-15889]|uniref:Manganese and iron superoxide dismutase n=1 Tax=Daedalea quercina L-15889 TaxID=1314783 RepID=A0A165U7T2_9APHY|nr:manganese and iron superoxide dismutase [Daedalea quercina L-15889]